MSTISVIVPVYKVEKYIHRCVDSILAQTFADFELILVDDGSPDNCGAICDEYAKKDSRVVVIHQENGGLSAARNAGIDWAFANSDSEWLTFIDSDDWIHPEYLQQLFTSAEELNVSVSVCSYEETEGASPTVDDSALKAILWSAEQFYMQKLVNATIACGKLYRKDCFEKRRYPVGRIHEDEFVTYRILLEAEKIAFVEAPLYAYFVNSSGITKSAWNQKRMDALDACQEQIAYFEQENLPSLKERSIRTYARMLMNQYKEYRNCASQETDVKSSFQKKAKWFLKNHSAYYQNDWETKVNLFWIAHPTLDRLYHKLKK